MLRLPTIMKSECDVFDSLSSRCVEPRVYVHCSRVRARAPIYFWWCVVFLSTLHTFSCMLSSFRRWSCVSHYYCNYSLKYLVQTHSFIYILIKRTGCHSNPHKLIYGVPPPSSIIGKRIFEFHCNQKCEKSLFAARYESLSTANCDKHE